MFPAHSLQNVVLDPAFYKTVIDGAIVLCCGRIGYKEKFPLLQHLNPLHSFFFFLFFLFYFFKFYFIFKLYITVLVLPNIKMNPPQVYMCSPS